MIERALEWMPYQEIMSMPPRAVEARMLALERRHAQYMYDVALTQAKVGDVNWGQAYEGKAPDGDPKYKTVDTPFMEYLEDLGRAAGGLPPIERQQVAKQKKRQGLLAAFGFSKKGS